MVTFAIPFLLVFAVYFVSVKNLTDEFNLIFNECKMIKDNFSGLNQLSINKGFEVFFEEIEMEFGDVELGAIKAISL